MKTGKDLIDQLYLDVKKLGISDRNTRKITILNVLQEMDRFSNINEMIRTIDSHLVDCNLLDNVDRKKVTSFILSKKIEALTIAKREYDLTSEMEEYKTHYYAYRDLIHAGFMYIISKYR